MRLRSLLAAASLLLSTRAIAQPSPYEVAARVANRIVADTRLAFMPAVAEAEQGGVYLMDFYDALVRTPGQAYFATADVHVDSSAAVQGVRLGLSPSAGQLEVRLDGQVVYSGTHTGPAALRALDYDLTRYTVAVPVTLVPGTHHRLDVRLVPTGDEGRVYLGFVGPGVGLTATGLALRAPGLPEEDATRFGFLVAGPAPITRQILPRVYGQDLGDGVRWELPRLHLTSRLAAPLDMSDWRYFTGAMLDALRETSATFDGLDQMDFVRRHAAFFLDHVDGITRERAAAGLRESAFGHYFRFQLLDDFGPQAAGLLASGDPRGRAVAERAVVQLLNGVPRTADGAFARLNPDSLTVWADDLFMGGILLIRAAEAFNRPELLDEAARQAVAMHRALYDPATGVYYHGRLANGQPSSSRWARANGWTMLARAELLKALPASHPMRAAVLEMFRQHAEGLLRRQDTEGRWHQVLDRPDTYLETSATAMFVRAFALGVRNGWLPEAPYRDAALRGWAAVARQVREDGRVEGIVRGTPIFANDEAYQQHATRLNDPRGLAAVLYAANAVAPLVADQQRAAERLVGTFEARNGLAEPRTDAPVVLTRADLGAALDRPLRVLRRHTDGTYTEIPSQRDDLDGDGRRDELFVLLDLARSETAVLEVREAAAEPRYPARTQAFLKVQQGGRFENGKYVGGGPFVALTGRTAIPPEQVQDTGWSYFEGPIWESDRVGFRFYLDARSRFDVFGKSTPDLVLHDIQGNYHAVSDWGADVLKVSASLGVGTPAVVAQGGLQTLGTAPGRTFEVVANGPLRAILRQTYTGWDVDGRPLQAISEQEIHAGQRWAEQRLIVTDEAGRPVNVTLATGIVRHPAVPMAATGSASGYRFAYTWGAQAEQGDTLGMAVLLPERFAPQPLADPLSHAFRLTPQQGRIAYRYAAGWQFERDPFVDGEAFEAHLRDLTRGWASPVRVTRVRR
ncbi:MAG TPA: DUF4861 family protein [Rhodothermales bacterium]|nr:DUF4861 family protein [Rhodothermales bacterium]